MLGKRFLQRFTRTFYSILRAIPVLALLLSATQFTFSAGAIGTITASKTDSIVVDGNNNGQADLGDTLGYSVVVTNTGSADSTNVQFSDTLDANTTLAKIGTYDFKTTPIARDDSYSTVGNVQLSVAAAQGVLNNDNDPDGTGAVTISTSPSTSANGGNVSLSSNGSFTYNPPAGFSGTDTFTYTVQDVDNNTDTATVSIAVGQVVWFINNTAAAPGDGRFTSPFSSVANFNSLAADDPGDYIFVYQGSGAYSGAFTLLNNQQLIGNGVGITISPNLSIAAGTRPTISNVTLASGNTVRGLNISVSSGTGISGASVGTLTINNVSVTNTAGAAVSLASGALAVTFDSISSNGGVNGVNLSGVSGSFAMNGGTIQNSTGHGFNVSNTSGTMSALTLQNSTFSSAAAGQNGVNIEVPPAGTAAFTAITVTGNTFSNNGGTGLRASIQGTGSIGKINVGSNTFTGNPIGVDLSTNGTASLKYDIHNNTMSGTSTQANIAANDVTHNNGVGPFMEGYIRNNTITTSPTGSVYIAVWVVSDGDGNITTAITGNTINNFGDSGIDVESRGGTGDVNATISNNSASTTATFPIAGMFLRSGNGTLGETSLLCVNVSANNMAGGAGAVADYYLDRFNPATTVFQIQGLSPSPATPAQTASYITSTDSAPPATAYVENGSYTAATCNTVSFAFVPGTQQLAQAPAHARASLALPSLAGLEGKFAGLVNGLVSRVTVRPAYASGETISATLGTLNAGQQVTITFRATIDNLLVPSTTTQFCNQGTVTGDGGLNVLTDDPSVGGASDPTCTPLADEIPPDTTIDSSPANPSNSSSASFTFSGTDNPGGSGIASFECKLDGGAFAACTSPQSYTGLADGSHNFQVRAIDGAGNVDQSPASFTWSIDATPPAVTIDQASGQADPTSSSPIHFTAVFSEPVTGFASGDVTLGGTAGATTTAVTEIAPNDGTTYDVSVSGMSANGDVTASIPANGASDAAGNGNTASTSTDNTVTFVLSVPDLTVTKSHTGDFHQAQSGAQYTITVSNSGTGPTSGTVTVVDTLPAGLTGTAISGTGWTCNLATITCTRSDALAAGSSYPAITLTVDVAANAPASVTNSVTVSGGGETNTANNTATDPTTVIADSTPPDTTIDSSPSDPSYNTGASFTFSGTDNPGGSGVASFECKLDGGAFGACVSPKSYSGLTLGLHIFDVRAIDLVGNVDPTPASFTWQIMAHTSLLYNGAQIVNIGNTFKPAALLSSSASACVSGKTISFSLDRNPTTGIAGSYLLGTATTNSSGQATMSAIGTTGWQEGIYDITASFAGTANCDPSSYTATLTVAAPGSSANGGGWYTLSGSGRINFGFTVRKVDSKCTSNCAYKGQMLLMNNGKWRLKGALDTYSKTSTGQGASSGVGDLYWWDPTLNGGLGDWVLAQSGVSFTINFYDSGKTGKSSTDSFGINIQYLPVPPQPGSLPNSKPIVLKGGNITVK